jgi:hypothetical protein
VPVVLFYSEKVGEADIGVCSNDLKLLIAQTFYPYQGEALVDFSSVA